MKRLLFLFLYYGLISRLPSSALPFIGKVCKSIRGSICRPLFSSMGNNVNIESRAYFGSGKGIRIGDDSGIGQRCEVRPPVSIGKKVMMAPEVMIIRSNHEISRTDIPMMGQRGIPPVELVIEDNVWIGARVIILPSCRHIGKGSVLAAGAVVTKDVLPFSIVGGNPAKVIRMRKEQDD